MAVTARKPHFCGSCGRPPGMRGVATILPGHRYLRHVAFPEGSAGEINQSDRPIVMKECVACATEREVHAGSLEAGACASFCHGETPCARPLRHDDDHECRGCPRRT
jgi:hypothetical protein